MKLQIKVAKNVDKKAKISKKKERIDTTPSENIPAESDKDSEIIDKNQIIKIDTQTTKLNKNFSEDTMIDKKEQDILKWDDDAQHSADMFTINTTLVEEWAKKVADSEKNKNENIIHPYILSSGDSKKSSKVSKKSSKVSSRSTENTRKQITYNQLMEKLRRMHVVVYQRNKRNNLKIYKEMIDPSFTDLDLLEEKPYVKIIQVPHERIYISELNVSSGENPLRIETTDGIMYLSPNIARNIILEAYRQRAESRINKKMESLVSIESIKEQFQKISGKETQMVDETKIKIPSTQMILSKDSLVQLKIK